MTMSQRQQLSQHGVVARLVEGFSTDIVRIFDSKIASGPGGKDAEDAILARCAEIANIFKGKDPGYELPSWQAEGRLEGRIVGWFTPRIKGSEDVILMFFKHFATAIILICRSMHEGMAEEEAGPRLHGILNDVVEKLVGIQS